MPCACAAVARVVLLVFGHDYASQDLVSPDAQNRDQKLGPLSKRALPDSECVEVLCEAAGVDE